MGPPHLSIRVGPDFDTLSPAYINQDHQPNWVEGPHFKGFICIRLRGWNGAVSSPGASSPVSPSTRSESSYFEGKSRRYSIMVQGHFTTPVSGNDVMFGAECDRRVRLPFGANAALGIAKWLDPNIEADLHASRPALYSPLLCAMNNLSVYPRHAHQVNDRWEGGGVGNAASPPHPVTHPRTKRKSFMGSLFGLNHLRDRRREGSEGSTPSVKSNVKKTTSPQPSPQHDHIIPCPHQSPSSTATDVGLWSWHSRRVPEEFNLLFAPSDNNSGSNKPDQDDTTASLPFIHPTLTTYERRKRYFNSAAHRAAILLRPDLVYCMDYYDAYFDPLQIALSLPGYSLSLLQYWDGQRFFYVCRHRNGQIFFVVCFEWVVDSTPFVTPSR